MLHSVYFKLLSLHGLVTLGALFLYVLTSHALQQRRHPSAAIGWVLFILLLPYAALPLYMLFGTRKITHSEHIAGIAGAVAGGQAAPRGANFLVRVTAALGQPRPAAYRELHIHADGAQALAAVLEVIDGARQSIDLCTFILRGDAVGREVCQRLAVQAHKGVKVRVLVDGVGRLMGGGADFSQMVAAGIQVARFPPSLRAPFRGRANLRNHRKLLVADAGTAAERMICGGRNLAAEYFGGAETRPGQTGAAPWRDLTFDVRGPLARQGAALFERGWCFAIGEDQRAVPALASGDAEASAGSPARPGDAADPPNFAAAAPLQDAPAPTAQLIASGPDEEDDTVHALLVTGAYRASTRIALVSPYVVLEEALLMALCLAARRGVQVDLLLPAHSNHRLADAARHRSLRALAGAGVRVWLAPGMLHAKLAVVDERVALAGSANLDGRSLFLNYEVMAAFDYAPDVARFRAWFDAERENAAPYVSQPPGLLRDIGEGLLLWVGFQV
ncbi:MAG: cardiolipin synthase [Bradyrhizobium sp.]|nr:cardiolipin synthase [Bradyrhizobium sp.]